MQPVMGIAPSLAYVGSGIQPRLVKAAHEFESQLMKELLKPMASASMGSTEDTEASSGSILGDFAAEALGRSLSEHGGLGIATRIVQSLSYDGNRKEATTSNGNRESNLQ